MNILEISLLGRFHVRSKGTLLAIFNIQKVQELLSYLLLYRHSPHHREFLATLLWENVSTAQSKQYLRKALWQLQSTLGQHMSDSDLLLIEENWIQVNPAANYWLDLAEFEDIYRHVQKIDGGDLSHNQVKIMINGIEVYQGDLLQGWYQEWCLTERERFQYMYLDMLDKLMDYHLVHAEYASGIERGLQILRCDLARERTFRQLMYMLALSGDRTGAIRMYERCIAVLEAELGVKPAESTFELYQQICADRCPPVHALLLPARKPVNRLSTQLQEVSQYLTNVKTILHEAQEQLEVQLAVINEMRTSSNDS